MRYLRWLVVGVLLALCGCARETKNVGTGFSTGNPQSVNITITVPIGITHGSTGTFRANWQGGIGPHTVVWDFTGGIAGGDPAPQVVNDQPASTTVTFQGSTRGPTYGSVTVTVTDSNPFEHFRIRATSTRTFTVPIIPVPPPFIDTSVAGNTVTVTVWDADGDDMTITWVATGGTGSPATGTVTGGSGTTNFSFSPDDFFAGGAVSVTFTGTDSFGNTGTATANLTFPALVLADDTLYAIPLSSSVAAGGRVRVVVASGNPANPFFYMTGVRLTIPQAANAMYVGSTAANGGTGDVPGSFNVGAVGGNAGDPDGIWTDQGATNFLLPPDNFIQRSDAGGGLHGIDFNVTPLDGSDMADGSGALFNIELEFPNAGTYELGFQDVNVVNRTYYQDSSQAPDYFWSDITNNHAGIPNSVTVI